MTLKRIYGALCAILALTVEGSQNSSACSLLASHFPGKTFVTGSSNYTAEFDELSTWSQTCSLSPACFFTPDRAEDVAVGLQIVQRTGTQFSIRSGGHMPVVNAQSNDGGVVFALANINTKVLSDDQTIASLGPGSRWGEVYNWLYEFGLAVPGGRYSDVGVGGLLVGGGFNFFGNSKGWSVSNILSAQVVLGNGTIVEASNTSHSDLLWALKGGNNNFGIVTRFDVATFACPTAYGGSLAWSGEQATASLIDAVQLFITPGGGIDDPNTEINPSFSVTPGVEGGGWAPFIVPFVLGDFSNSTVPASVSNFTSIPNATLDTVYQHTNWTEIPSGSYNDANTLRRAFACLSAKIAPGLVQLAVDQVLKPSLTNLSEVDGASLTLEIEPVSQLWLQASKDRGEYALDLDPADGSFVVLLFTTTWNDEASDEAVYSYMNGTLDRLQNSLVQQDLLYDFIYINDALDGQYPYSTYGKGKSLPRMKEVQSLYDSEQVIKNLATSGFKL